MPAVQLGGHVHVHDVSLAQHLRAGDAVAHHLVHRARVPTRAPGTPGAPAGSDIGRSVLPRLGVVTAAGALSAAVVTPGATARAATASVSAAARPARRIASWCFGDRMEMRPCIAPPCRGGLLPHPYRFGMVSPRAASRARLGRVSLEQLETVVAIAEEGAMVRARRALAHQSAAAHPPPARARRGARRRACLKLLASRGMTPTPAGERFIERARAILASVADARHADPSAASLGRVRAGACPRSTHRRSPRCPRRSPTSKSPKSAPPPPPARPPSWWPS